MGSALYQRIRWMVILWLARRLPDCKATARTLSESIDRKLTLRERFVTRLHIFTCEACGRYIKQITFLSEAVRAHGDETAPDTDKFASARLSPSAKDRIKDLLKTQSGFAILMGAMGISLI